LESTRGKKVIDNILQQREKRYGQYIENARLTQELKDVMRSAEYWRIKPDIVRESLDQIQAKIARILNGDDRYPDNFVDIIGYAKLVLDEIAPEQAT
jgi:hypothetical protein